MKQFLEFILVLSTYVIAVCIWELLKIAIESWHESLHKENDARNK